MKSSITHPYSQPIRVYGAGSLRMAFHAIIQSFTEQYQIPVETQFGASGLLRERIEQGEQVDIFASADIAHPTQLMAAGKSSPVVNFARNRICAFAQSDLPMTSATLLDFMLNPEIRVGTSTPGDDPSGDYVWEMFRKADRLLPGSFERLSHKALCLTGGRNTPKVPKGSHIAAHFILETQQADIFLTYFTAALTARQQGIALRVVSPPKPLSVTAPYGMTLMNTAQTTASLLVMYILSPIGQAILGQYGFDVFLTTDTLSMELSNRSQSQTSCSPVI